MRSQDVGGAPGRWCSRRRSRSDNGCSPIEAIYYETSNNEASNIQAEEQIKEDQDSHRPTQNVFAQALPLTRHEGTNVIKPFEEEARAYAQAALRSGK